MLMFFTISQRFKLRPYITATAETCQQFSRTEVQWSAGFPVCKIRPGANEPLLEPENDTDIHHDCTSFLNRPPEAGCETSPDNGMFTWASDLHDDKHSISHARDENTHGKQLFVGWTAAQAF